MSSDETDITAEKLSVMPMYIRRLMNGVKVIRIEQIPWHTMAMTGVRHVGSTFAATLKNAPLRAMA